MRKLLFALFISLFAHSAGADILIHWDFESLPPSENIKISNCTQGDNVGEIVIDEEVAYNGSGYWHAYVQPFDTSEYGATNCSIGPQNYDWMGGTNNFQFGTEYWTGIAVYIESPFTWPDITYMLGDGQGEWGLLFQWHAIIELCDDANLNPPIAHFIDNSRADGSLEISILGDANECVDKPNYDRSIDYDFGDNSNLILTTGTWHRIVENFQFSYTTGGFYKLWIDGNLVVDDSGINCYNHAKAPYLMIGPYGHYRAGIHVRYDEFRVGDENSSYEEVLPKGGTPDSTPPTLSGGYPTEVLTEGTTSASFGCASSEPATCRQSSNVAHEWADMAEMSTTGTQSHEETATGLSSGVNNRYIICRDASSNESDKLTITLTVDSGGAYTNLISAETVQNYTGDKQSAIYDGCTDDIGECLAEITGNEVVLEVHFPGPFENISRHFFGDDVGSRVSKTLTLDWKLNSGDSWTNFETDTNVYESAWNRADLTGIIARYIRVTVKSDTGYTQFREMELVGTPYSGGGESPSPGKATGIYGGPNGANGQYSANGLTAP